MRDNGIVPYYYHQKRNLWILVLATAIFTEAFILIFQPFQSRSWAVDDMQYLRWVTIVVIAEFVVIGVSRWVMCAFAKRHTITYLSHAIWILCEILAMATIYTVFPFVVLPQYVQEHHLLFFDMFREAALDTAFILLIPYTVVYLVIELRSKNALLEQITQGSDRELHPDMLNFYDEKGELKLSVKPEMVYYVESQDNYVAVHYRLGDKPLSLMIRNSLKNMETPFVGSGLVRCHRSFIVNLKCVQLLRRENNELRLDFGRTDIPAIPVSKAYAKQILDHFTNNS